MSQFVIYTAETMAQAWLQRAKEGGLEMTISVAERAELRTAVSDLLHDKCAAPDVAVS